MRRVETREDACNRGESSRLVPVSRNGQVCLPSTLVEFSAAGHHIDGSVPIASMMSMSLFVGSWKDEGRKDDAIVCLAKL